MEKYGFVYIWYDCKHKRYYIGCRWGKEDDGYVCSSSWMKQGYKHRSQDFKRRILSRVYTNKKDLLEEEYRWLLMIKKDELGKRYYNLHNHHFNHWSTDENKKLTVGQKITKAQLGRTLSEEHKRNIGKANSISLRGKRKSDEARKKMSDYWKNRKQDPNTTKKIAMSNKGKKREIVQCPHCSKSGGINAMHIWHFDKCRYKEHN